jgi:mycoredoxin
MDVTPWTPSRGSVTMFTTPWCGFCVRLKRQLTDADISFTEVDIEQTPDAAVFVESQNDGNQTVPTLVFPDGSTATNPSLADVTSRLA